MSTTNKILIPVAIILAGLFIAGAVVWNGTHPYTGSTSSSGSGTTEAVNINNVSTSSDPFIGNPNARVTVAFWSDYQCPYCKAFEVGGISAIPTPAAMPDILTNYVNTGQVKIVFKDFPFLGPDSIVDAEYARAVWALYPNQYFAWRTAMFTNQPQENSLSAADNLTWILKTTGSISGIDVIKVQSAVTSNQSAYDTAINADKAEGEKFGINATPSFIIGTQVIAGAYPYSTFQQALDAQLSQYKN